MSACPGCGLLLRGPLASQLLQTLQTADQLLARLQAVSKQPLPEAPRPAPSYAVARPTVATPPLPAPLPRTERRGISTVSVPKLLLSLGALCLLVAAVIFLAVAWGWLGVGGRTAVLAGLTLVSGGLGVWLTRRDLRVAGEAVTTVGLGLLVLDAIGADNSGWLGDRTVEGLVAVVGGLLLAAALPLALTTRLIAPQLVAAAALSVLGAGMIVVTGHGTAVTTAAIIGYLGLAAASGVRRLRTLLVAAAVGAALWWFGLAFSGWVQAVDHPSVHGLWVEGHGVSLLVAALLLLAPAPFVRSHDGTLAFTAVSAAMLTVLAGLPAVDESLTVIGIVALAVLVGWTVVSLVTPVAWRPVPRVSMLVAALPVFLVTATLAALAIMNAVGSHEPFTRTVTTLLGNPDPLAAPVLLLLGVSTLLGAVVSLLPRPIRMPLPVPVGVVALAAIGTLALHPVPAWTVAGTLALLGAALVANALTDPSRFGVGEALAGVGVALAGLVVALPSDVLTAAVLAALVAMTGTMLWLGSVGQRVWGGVLAPAAVAGLVWTGCEIAGVETGSTLVGVVALVALAGWSLVSLVTPEEWRRVLLAPMSVAAVPLGLITAGLTAQAVLNALGDHEPFTQALTTRLGDPDAVAAPVLLILGVSGLLGAALSVLPRFFLPVQVPATVLALASIGTIALHPVPAWTVAFALVLLGAGLVADALRYEGSFGLVEAIAGVAVVACGGLVALPSDILTALVLAALVALAGALYWKGWVEQQAWGGALLPVSLAGFLWVACEVAGVDESWRGVPILLVLGLLAIARPQTEIEVPAALSGAAAAAVAIHFAADTSVALAIELTIAGALVSASALIHPNRRLLGWPGGMLLALATWVRLADIGVNAPEPYTLPSAVALLVVGLFRIQRDPGVSTMRALGPGLVLATVPSLLWVLVDPVSPRAAWLGAACLGLVLAGVRLRWNAPVVVGAAVGGLVVLRELAPYTEQVPQWALIGLAGTVLTVVGVTWERRVRDVRTASAYVGRLR